MEIIKKIDDFLRSLERKDFYIYVSATLGVLCVFLALFFWQYYSSGSYYYGEIESINEKRSDVIKRLFEREKKIKLEQKEVDKLLAKDPNFKIKQYIEQLLQDLRLQGKKGASSTSSIEQENYRENSLQISFAGMNMKELCELLKKIEETKRVFIKRVDIQKSKKIANTIDVSLEIATLFPKSGEQR